jgi:alkylhydroperoxidase family enzyme
MRTGVIVWAGFCVLVSVVLATFSRRLGDRAIAWLVALGVSVLAIEEPVLTLWLSAATPTDDKDGIATLVTSMARAHVVTAAILTLVPAFVLVRVALTAFRRGDAWATRVLRWALALTLATELGTSTLIFSRGLPLPGPGGSAGASGFGWQPVAAGLFAWGLGLWLDARRRRRDAAEADEPSRAIPGELEGVSTSNERLAPIDRPRGIFLRLVYLVTRRRFGKTPMVFRVAYSRTPSVALVAIVITLVMERCLKLEPELRLMLQVAIASREGCTFCEDLSLAEAFRMRIGRERFRSLSNFEFSAAFSERERAALALATELLDSRKVTDASMARVRRSFDDREVVELLFVCAAERFYTSIALPLRIRSDGFSPR